MSEETVVQLAIVAFGFLWIGSSFHQYGDRYATGYSQIILSIVMGLFEALIIGFILFCAVVFVSALVGVFQ